MQALLSLLCAAAIHCQRRLASFSTSWILSRPLRKSGITVKSTGSNCQVLLFMIICYRKLFKKSIKMQILFEYSHHQLRFKTGKIF